MKFVFDEGKAAEAAAWLLKFAGGSMRYMKLLKLLYLADRRALIETGAPITGDEMFALPRGPVLSRVLDLMNSAPEDGGIWFEFVSGHQGYEVEAVREPLGEDSRLSDYEIGVLEGVWDEFGSMELWALVKHLHQVLPEWTDPRGSSRRIRPEDILRAADRAPEDIADAADEAREALNMDSLVAAQVG
jgi:uncharacterized phage-associated protein